MYMMVIHYVHVLGHSVVKEQEIESESSIAFQKSRRIQNL